MRTGVKAPLAILAALAFLDGCKSPQKTAFLRADDDAV
jgi:hypothetical protein